jgi:hypothetical protein
MPTGSNVGSCHADDGGVAAQPQLNFSHTATLHAKPRLGLLFTTTTATPVLSHMQAPEQLARKKMM